MPNVGLAPLIIGAQKLGGANGVTNGHPNPLSAVTCNGTPNSLGVVGVGVGEGSRPESRLSDTTGVSSLFPAMRFSWEIKSVSTTSTSDRQIVRQYSLGILRM